MRSENKEMCSEQGESTINQSEQGVGGGLKLSDSVWNDTDNRLVFHQAV